MRGTLNIASDLALPIEAVTETFAILAKRGKGKTNTAVVMAEEMIGAGQPVVVLDPVGVWWGLRSAANGRDDGLPVLILGGDHGDLPLKPEAGALVAETVVASRSSFVIDLSSLSKTASRRFATDFVETLYHRNREPLHVIVDEADAFAPQRSMADTARLLGAMEDLVRRGRARGLGITLITQRPASLHKDVLTQAEVLIALGMTGPRDVAAIDEWVRLHADEDDAKAVKASLPSLPVGTAWVWSPGWLDVLRKVKIRARRTFDSSATPKPGQERAKARHMTPVDIAALGEQMTALAEEAKANDPRALRAEVSRLERELAQAAANVPEPEQVEVPRLPAGFRDALSAVEVALAAMLRVTADVREATGWEPPAPARIAPTAAPERRAPRPALTTSPPTSTTASLSKAQRSILSVIATYGPRPKASVATLAGYSAKGGGFNNAIGALRTAGYLDRGEPLTATDDGLAALGPVDPLPTGAELREHWKRQPALGKAHGLILDALDGTTEEATMHADVLADITGYAPTGGGFNNALGRLRSLGLIHGPRDGLYIDEDLL